MAKYQENGVQYIVKTTKDENYHNKYLINEYNEIIMPKKTINAIDIDWNGATIGGANTKPIQSTSDLLKFIYDIQSSNNNIINQWTIGTDGYWYKYGNKTNYKADNTQKMIVINEDEYDNLNDDYNNDAVYFIYSDDEE